MGKIFGELKMVTVKAIIETGIIKGRTINAILKQIRKARPSSKADVVQVKWYASKLKRQGDINAEQKKKYVSKIGRPSLSKTKKQ